MNGWQTTFLRIGLLTLAVMVLASCAQYSARTNKAQNFSAKLTNVYMWSGIGTVEPFTRKLPFADDTFENLFNVALTRKFSESGIRNELRRFSPSTDSMTDLARFEGALNPDYRLLVVPSKYETITYKGITNVNVLYLDVSVIHIKDTQRVWRSEIVVDTNTAPGTAWREAGANKLVVQIVDALKRDGLI